MSALSFSPVPENEHERALAALVSAFTDDPVERWLYPETQKYLTHFPEFLAAFGGKAFDKKTVWSLRDFAAARWLPPSVPDDVVARLELLAARDATSVGAVAVRELAEVSRRADNPALLGSLPDVGVNTATILHDLDAGRVDR